MTETQARREEAIPIRRYAAVSCSHQKCLSRICETLKIFGGRAKNQRCALSAAAQREQYASTGQPRSHPDFVGGKLTEAQVWFSAFLSSNRGVNFQSGNKFQASHVKAAERRLHLCAAGVDGLNERWLLPAATLMLHGIAALFSVIYASGTPIVDWCLSIVASIKKKEQDIWVLDNYRGIHLLPIIRQLYSLCLLTEIEDLCIRNILENQQDFIKGGRIYASLFSFCALVEAARLQQQRLYVTFVGVRKAFPSAKRGLPLQIFSQKGASDELVRATWAL